MCERKLFAITGLCQRKKCSCERALSKDRDNAVHATYYHNWIKRRAYKNVKGPNIPFLQSTLFSNMQVLPSQKLRLLQISAPGL